METFTRANTVKAGLTASDNSFGKTVNTTRVASARVSAVDMVFGKVGQA